MAARHELADVASYLRATGLSVRVMNYGVALATLGGGTVTVHVNLSRGLVVVEYYAEMATFPLTHYGKVLAADYAHRLASMGIRVHDVGYYD